VAEDRPVGRVRRGTAVDAELARAAAFRTALRRFLLRTDAVAALGGLTPQRYDLLLMIRAHRGPDGAVPMAELRGLLQLRQTAVTELVKRTEEAGLIERRPSPEDKRAWLLQLTKDGDERLLRVFDALRDDRAALTEVFRDVDERFQAATRQSSARR
jgi:DNA-binding MarR family transcriptional regulator